MWKLTKMIRKSHLIETLVRKHSLGYKPVIIYVDFDQAEAAFDLEHKQAQLNGVTKTLAVQQWAADAVRDQMISKRNVYSYLDYVGIHYLQVDEDNLQRRIEIRLLVPKKLQTWDLKVCVDCVFGPSMDYEIRM